MQKKYFIILLGLVIVGSLIFTNIKFKETVEFDSDCILFEIGSFDFDLVNVKIEGKIRKKFFEDKGDVYLRIEMDEITYPIRTNSIESVPVYSQMKLQSYDYKNYIMIPLQNSYWDHNTNEPFFKFHGVLYIDIKNEIVLIAPAEGGNNFEEWSFEEGYPVIITGKDITSSIEKIEEYFKWNLEDLRKYYESSDQN